jgi:hypothetical protein
LKRKDRNERKVRCNGGHPATWSFKSSRNADFGCDEFKHGFIAMVFAVLAIFAFQTNR